jgi:hypothetical protein
MPEPDAAKARFFVITGLRGAAALMIVAGMIIGFGEREFIDPVIRLPVGLALIGVGLIDLLVVVPLLIRKWRSQQ